MTKIRLAETVHNSVLHNDETLTPTDILAAAKNGDEAALAALADVGRALGIVLSACAAILNPARFVIGGGLGVAGFDFVVPAVREEMMRRTIPNTRVALDIVPSRVGSCVIGSACLVWYA